MTASFLPQTSRVIPQEGEREGGRPTVRLLDVDVWGHGEKRGHTVFVRGKFPNRVWRCARHDCDWIHVEGLS